MNYTWPGNIRELETFVERIIVLTHNKIIEEKDISKEICGFSHAKLHADSTFVLGDNGIVFDKLEKDILMQALKKSNGVMADAAKLLGMTYRTFQYRAFKFGLRGK